MRLSLLVKAKDALRKILGWTGSILCFKILQGFYSAIISGKTIHSKMEVSEMNFHANPVV